MRRSAGRPSERSWRTGCDIVSIRSWSDCLGRIRIKQRLSMSAVALFRFSHTGASIIGGKLFTRVITSSLLVIRRRHVFGIVRIASRVLGMTLLENMVISHVDNKVRPIELQQVEDDEQRVEEQIAREDLKSGNAQWKEHGAVEDIVGVREHSRRRPHKREDDEYRVH